MKAKLTKAEKQLIRAMIAYNKEKQIENDARWIEIGYKDYTGVRNQDHRYLVEEYAQELID